MDSGEELNHSDEAKSKLVDILTKYVSQSKILASERPSAYIVIIDAKQIGPENVKPSISENL